MRAGTGHSKHRNAEEAARIACRMALDKAGLTRADTVLFFTSCKYRKKYAPMLEKIRRETGARVITGASGFGVLTEDVEIEHQAAVAVMVMDAPELETSSFIVPNLQESSYRAGESMARLMRERTPADLALIFPDSFSFQSHSFLDGFENAYGYVPLVGGAAAEDGREAKTYQFTQDQIAYDSVAGLMLSGPFRQETGLALSCHAVGDSFRVTRAEGNFIYEMDGRPAYDILLESISQIGFDKPEQMFQHVFLGLPLKDFQTDFSGSPYLVRNIMGANAKKGMLTCIAPVEEGDFVTFALRDPDMARLNLHTMLCDLAARMAPSRPVCGFYFNCCARGELLYGRSGVETEMIREAFPGLPLLGFFTYGELAPVDHVNHLHHHAAVLTLLAAKD